MADLATFAQQAIGQKVTDKSEVRGSFEWISSYDSPRSLERQLAKAGIELVPQAEIYYVVMVVRRPNAD